MFGGEISLSQLSHCVDAPPTGDATEIRGASAGTQMFHRLEDAQRDLETPRDGAMRIFYGYHGWRCVRDSLQCFLVFLVLEGNINGKPYTCIYIYMYIDIDIHIYI